MSCLRCVHYDACMRLIDAEHETLIVCEHFRFAEETEKKKSRKSGSSVFLKVFRILFASSR